MIRVAIVFNATDAGWQGGVNYLSNLCHAVLALPDRKIEPVIFVAPDAPASLLAGFVGVTVIRTPFVARRHPLRLLGKAVERVTGRNLVIEAYLRAKGVRVISHSPPLGAHSSIPSITWVPDFQHLHLPAFFSPEEIQRREVGYRQSMRQSQRVILSSRDAQKDLARFDPASLDKSRVLNFVSGFAGAQEAADTGEICARYGIDRPFFYLPNQFWKHKNHRVVVDALALLRAQGTPLLVISTGLMEDYRAPGFAKEITDHAEARGVAQDFRPLGLVPFSDVTALYRHALAVVNPSLFEGWSSSVEEAKSLGKILVLSDIPVHREQAPERGLFFSPDNPDALAQRMLAAARDASPESDALFRAKAERALPTRIAAFAHAYQQVVLEVAASPASGNLESEAKGHPSA